MQLHLHLNPAAIPALPLDHIACARLLCDACGRPGWWWVLPAGAMAVEIYNVCDFHSTECTYRFYISLCPLCAPWLKNENRAKQI